MLNEAFAAVCKRIEEALTDQGFVKAKIKSDDINELVSLFTSDNMAYSVIYYKDKMHMVLRECRMTDDGPDNDWKPLATWMFDPSVDTLKEANSIGNDFAEAVSAPKAVKKVKQAKKSTAKKGDEGNADPLFFSKRLVQLFPELKEEIKDEEDCYYPFRGVTFARASIVPKINDLVVRGTDADLKKLGGILSAQYANGNADTRSIVTIVVLNSVPAEYDEKLEAFLSDDLKKAARCARRYRGKTVRPEKEKKPRKTIAQRLGQ